MSNSALQPADFKGVPDDVLSGLESKLAESQKAIDYIEEEKQNMASTHEDLLRSLLASFAIAVLVPSTSIVTAAISSSLFESEAVPLIV